MCSAAAIYVGEVLARSEPYGSTAATPSTDLQPVADPDWEPDEADLAYRIHQAGWRIATCGYERLGAYFHLGSTTISRVPPAPYLARVLENGRLFHSRWDAAIAAEHPRAHKTWRRRPGLGGWAGTVAAMGRTGLRRRTAGRPA